MRLFQAGDTDHALEVLQDYKNGLASSGIDADHIALLRRPIDARLASLNMVKKQRDMEKQQVDKHDSADKKIKHELLAEQEKKDQVKGLMDQHRALYREAKYQEALVCAQKARDLDPDNDAAGAAIYMTTLRLSDGKAQALKEGKEKYALEQLNDTDKVGPPLDMDNPLAVNQKVSMQARDRKSIESLRKINNVHSEKEHAIYRRLDQPISSMDFKDTPLKQILDDLQGLTGINIVTDVPALNDAGARLDTQ